MQQSVRGEALSAGFTNGFTGLGSTGIYRDYNINNNAFGKVTKTFGVHTIVAGVTYDHYQKKENATGGNQGGFTFQSPSLTGLGVTSLASAESASFAAFLIGDGNGGFSQTSSAITPDIQENIFEAYIQDNWKVTPRLSLNLGVRYSYFGQPIDGGGRLSNFNPASYSAAAAPAIGTDGSICFTSASSVCSGVTPNPNADFLGVNYINGLIFGGPTTNNQPSSYGSKVGQAAKNNFAPRVGFAFDLFGDGTTAFRGGYGWAFDEAAVSDYENEVFGNPPAVTTCSPSFANFDNPSTVCSANTPSTTPGRIVGSPLLYQTPYVQQYSLDLQRAITPTLLLDIGYFGTHGTHLLGLVDIDEAQPNAWVGTINPLAVSSTCKMPDTGVPALLNSTCDKAINRIRPYLGYFAIDAMRTIFSSNYNALQVKATKRFKGKSMVDANYTWSRDLTNAQNDYSTPPQNTYNISADYGRATYDRTNIITADYVWELPWFKEQKGLLGRVLGGWETSGILAINSGVPLTVTASTATAGAQITYGYTSVYNNSTNGSYVNDSVGLGINGNTNAGFRPDMIGNPNSSPDANQKIHTRQQWFYKGAFAAAPPSTANFASHAGNEHRGVIEGPGYWKWDTGIFRNFKIWEDVDFQFRAEAFNTLNHTNWAGTAGSAGTSSTYIGLSSTSSTFGQILADRDPRVLQVAGKIRF